jgi:drug/metabolite transporter (DMT)-like permease
VQADRRKIRRRNARRAGAGGRLRHQIRIGLGGLEGEHDECWRGFRLASVLAALGHFVRGLRRADRDFRQGRSRERQFGDAAQVAPIDKLSVVLVAVFGVVFLGERLSVVSWASIATVAAGAILVAIG